MLYQNVWLKNLCDMNENSVDHEDLQLEMDVALFIRGLEDDDLIDAIINNLVDVKYDDSECVVLACLDRFFSVFYYIDDEYALVFDSILEIDSDEYLDAMSEGYKYKY